MHDPLQNLYLCLWKIICEVRLLCFWREAAGTHCWAGWSSHSRGGLVEPEQVLVTCGQALPWQICICHLGTICQQGLAMTHMGFGGNGWPVVSNKPSEGFKPPPQPALFQAEPSQWRKHLPPICSLLPARTYFFHKPKLLPWVKRLHFGVDHSPWAPHGWKLDFCSECGFFIWEHNQLCLATPVLSGGRKILPCLLVISL